MARKFSEREKNNITNELIETGKRLFTTFGYQKTSIQDITKRVGIAQGTFYHFFRSKEDLYFDILELEEKSLRERIVTFKPNATLLPEEKLQQILRYIVTVINESALLQQFFSEDHLHLMRTFDKEKWKQHVIHDERAIQALLAHWEKENIYVTEEPDVVASILRALFILLLQREEIGVDTFDITLDRLIRYIASGLIRKE